MVYEPLYHTLYKYGKRAGEFLGAFSFPFQSSFPRFWGVFNKTIHDSTRACWIWDDYSQLGATCLVGYLSSHLYLTLARGIIVNYRMSCKYGKHDFWGSLFSVVLWIVYLGAFLIQHPNSACWIREGYSQLGALLLVAYLSSRIYTRARKIIVNYIMLIMHCVVLCECKNLVKRSRLSKLSFMILLPPLVTHRNFPGEWTLACKSVSWKLGVALSHQICPKQ